MLYKNFNGHFTSEELEAKIEAWEELTYWNNHAECLADKFAFFGAEELARVVISISNKADKETTISKHNRLVFQKSALNSSLLSWLEYFNMCNGEQLTDDLIKKIYQA